MRRRGHAARAFVVAAAAAGALSACGQTITPAYDVEVVTPQGVDPFAGAAKVVLEVGGRSSETAVTPGQPFSLKVPRFTPPVDAAGVPALGSVRVTARDARGAVVAFGESPPAPLVLGVFAFKVFVQAPATMGHLGDLPTGFSHHFTAAAQETGGQGAVLLGTGIVLAADATMPALSPQIYIFDPLHLSVLDAGLESGVGPLLRKDVAALTLGDQRVAVFGGEGLGAMSSPTFLSQLAFHRLTVSAATGGFAFDRTTAAVSTDAAGVARAGAAVAAVPVPGGEIVVAFGGRDASGPLASVLRLGEDPSASNLFDLSAPAMAAARVGHTATSVDTGAAAEVLVLGGPATVPDDAVAEIFTLGPPAAFRRVAAAEAGPNRHGHAALRLPDGRVLVVGGRGNDDAPLDLATVYDPKRGLFTIMPGFLHTARADAAAFVQGGDVVVAGGLDAAGAPIGDAEIFDAVTLAPVGSTAAVARALAQAAPLPNHATLLFGGEVHDGNGSVRQTGTVEIYQPRLASP